MLWIQKETQKTANRTILSILQTLENRIKHNSQFNTHLAPYIINYRIPLSNFSQFQLFVQLYTPFTSFLPYTMCVCTSFYLHLCLGVFVFPCVSICVYVCVCQSVYVFVHVCMSMLSMCVHMCLYICVSTWAYLYMCVYVCRFIHVCLCVFVCINVYVCLCVLNSCIHSSMYL